MHIIEKILANPENYEDIESQVNKFEHFLISSKSFHCLKKFGFNLVKRPDYVTYKEIWRHEKSAHFNISHTFIKTEANVTTEFCFEPIRMLPADSGNLVYRLVLIGRYSTIDENEYAFVKDEQPSIIAFNFDGSIKISAVFSSVHTLWRFDFNNLNFTLLDSDKTFDLKKVIYQDDSLTISDVIFRYKDRQITAVELSNMFPDLDIDWNVLTLDNLLDWRQYIGQQEIDIIEMTTL